MHDANQFLEALALVLGAAAATTVLCRLLRQPVVLGYLLAGILVGPHIAFPLFADVGATQTLSELGVILLMFALGLEFRLGKLIQLGPTAGLIALIHCSSMLWLGFALGRAFDWSVLESLFTGAIVAISSTTIVAKAFDELQIRGRLRELVVGELIVEDLIAVLLMAVLTAVSTGAGLSLGALAVTSGRLLAFLVGLVGVGLMVVPRLMRAIVRLGRPETTLVATIGLCFAIALLAQAFGYSVALGAFIAGSLVAESGEGHAIEPLVAPVRDVFAAIFFVSVGMLIDPSVIAANPLPVIALTVAVVLGKTLVVTGAAFLAGASPRTAVQAGMSLSQIGEFSFIIASLGVALGATREFLYPIAVAVSAVTALTAPLMIRASGGAANWVDRKLPKPVQTFAGLYGVWIERMREAPRRDTPGSDLRRLVALLLVDVALVDALIVSTALWVDDLTVQIVEQVGLGPGWGRTLVVGTACALSLPFLIGIIRIARRVGGTLAQRAFPAQDPGRLDLAEAPRRALFVSLELAIVLLAALPIAAVLQPFFGGAAAAAMLVLLLAILSVVFWRTATDFAGHVRAGAQMIVEVLAAQSSSPRAPVSREARPLEQVSHLLPGLGQVVRYRLDGQSPAIGQSLAELNLRGITGATVLAISRGSDALTIPAAREVLHSGDVLALSGSEEAVEQAVRLLAGQPTETPAAQSV